MSGDTVPGLSVVRLHYTADPEKATEPWKDYARAGMSAVGWEREFEMNARAGALSAVFREAYRPNDHERPLDPHDGGRLFHAWDFGRGFPARVWFSRTPFNGIRVYASMVGQSLPLRAFVDQTIAFEVRTWGEVLSGPRCFCDPAGNQDKDDGAKSVQILREYGFEPRWTAGGIEDGIEQMAVLMRTVQPDGPMFLVDPRWNDMLCHGLRGAYKRNKQGTPEREHESGIDVIDALRYGVRGTMPPKVARPPQRPAFRRDPVSGYGMPSMPTATPDFAVIEP